MRMLIAAEQLEQGQPVIIQDGLVRAAIPNVHRVDRVAGHAIDDIKKGELAVWDPVGRALKRKPKGS